VEYAWNAVKSGARDRQVFPAVVSAKVERGRIGRKQATDGRLPAERKGAVWIAAGGKRAGRIIDVAAAGTALPIVTKAAAPTATKRSFFIPMPSCSRKLIRKFHAPIRGRFGEAVREIKVIV
jgi:hypothetical protein